MISCLKNSFQHAIDAANPLYLVAPHLPAPPTGTTLVVGAGKAAASMAYAVEQAWPQDAPIEGLVITRYAHGLPTKSIQVVEAGHPVPDETGAAAAAEIMRRVSELTEQDQLIALFSGGGSSLLALPVPSVPIADLKMLTQALLHCGAPIHDINVVRKHVSCIQGGRLATACRAPITTLLISDITGDDPSTLASGPTYPDPSTFQDALTILQRYSVHPADRIQSYLESGARGAVEETPKPGHPAFINTTHTLIATAHQSLNAAADFFRSQNITPLILGDSVTGEAKEVAKVYAALVREIRQYAHPYAPPVVLLSGGECTVTFDAHATRGRGGRCTEFLLSLAIELNGMSNVYALAADTDGIDGTEDNAGAWLQSDTLLRAQKHGLDAQSYLDQHNSYAYFAALNQLVITGPTRTNVNDYRAILIL